MDHAVGEGERGDRLALERGAGRLGGQGEHGLGGLFDAVYDGGRDGCCDDRAAGGWAGYERGVAENHLDAVERQAGFVVDDLGEDGVGAGADVLGGGAYAHCAVIVEGDDGLRSAAIGPPACSAETPAEDEVALAHGADGGGSPAPAEFIRAELETLLVVAGGEWLAVGFVDQGVVRYAQGDGVHLELDGQLVHGGLDGKEAGDGTGAAHGRGGADVAADQRRGDEQIGCAVEKGSGLAAVLVDVVGEGGVIAVVLMEADELAVFGGTDADVLLGLGAMADGSEHEAAGYVDFDRTHELTAGHGGERRLGPGEELAAEAGAEEAGDDLDIFVGYAEHLGHDVLVVDDALGGLVEGESLAVPDGDGGVHLHGIVGFRRGDVDLIDLDRSGGEGGFDIAALAFGVERQLWGLGVVEVHRDVGLVSLIPDLDLVGSSVGLFERLGDDDGHVLAIVTDHVVGKGRARLAGVAAEAAGSGVIERADVAVMQDQEHAWHVASL